MKKSDMTATIIGAMIPSLLHASPSIQYHELSTVKSYENSELTSLILSSSHYFKDSSVEQSNRVTTALDFTSQKVSAAKDDYKKYATLSFLQEQGLLESDGMELMHVSGEVNLNKELAASCRIASWPSSYSCTEAFGSQASCEQSGGVWYPDTNNCTVAASPDPDINLRGNGQPITSGDITPSASDHTDFGSHQTGASNFTRTFTIENIIASSTLTLSGASPVSISGSSDFSISSQPSSSSLNGVTSTTFVVQLDPTTVGSPEATVTISSDDPDEGSYTFKVGATVTAANNLPTVDLNGANANEDVSVSFSEGSGGVDIAPSTTVADDDSDTIKTITVSLTNDKDGISEGLSVSAAAQDALNGISNSSDITLQDTISITNATASVAEVQSFLRAIKYNNTSSTPNETDRTVTVVVNDGTDNSVSRTSTISVTNVTSTTSSGASFNTTSGANLNPAISFSGEDETLTIAQTSHVSGSTADGGDGTDTLIVDNGVDISNLTSLINFETLSPSSSAFITLKETQHDAFATINGDSTHQFTLSSADGDGALTGNAGVGTYVLSDAFTFTLGSASQNVTGSSSNDVINVAAFTPTGTLNAGGGTGDTLRLATGANIAGATVSNTEILELGSGASVTMTEAQHDSFSSMTAPGSETITISAATDGLTGNSAIESYVLSTSNTFKLGSAGQNVTGSANNDTINVGTLTATGTLAGSSGTDTLSVGNGGSIAGATVSGFENLTLSTGASATFSAAQLSLFSGTITAAGTETISVSGDGNVSTLAGIENYTIGDDSTNTRTVTIAAAGHSVTANSATDAVTFDVGTLTFTGTLIGENTSADTLSLSNGADISGATISNITNLALATGASVTMTAAQNESFSGSITAGGTETIVISGDGDITTRSGIENYTVGDDSSNTRTINVGATTSVTATSATDAITFNIAGKTFLGSLTGQSTAADIVSASDGANTTGATFSNVGTLSLASGATVTIDAQNISDFSTAINGAAGTETLNLVSGGTFDFSSTSVSSIETISLGSNIATSVTITDNFSSNGGTVTVSNSSGSAINAGVTINASALVGDSLVISATDLTGNDTLTGGDSADTLRPGSGTDSITGNGGNDNFVGSASDLNGDTIVDLAIGDMITVTGTTGLTTSNVRFNGNGTLQIDTDATDFAATEIALSLSNSPGASIDFTVADSGADTVITFIAANDVPVFSSLNGLSTFTENGSAVAVDNDVTVTDTELDALNSGNGNYNGASITIARNGGANTNDVFSNLNLLGALVQGSAFTYNGTSVGTVTTNSNGTLVLTFNSSATSAIVDGVLQSIAYSNSSDDPVSSVTLDYTFNDGTANSSGTNQAVVNITAQNDAPTDIALSANSINQSATGSAVTVGALTTTDVDASNSHTYTLVNSGASVTGSCSASTGNASFQISGSNLQTQAAIAAGTYIVCVQTHDGTTSFQKAFTITVSDDVAPDAPSTPDLISSSDTGASSSDNLTTDTTPTFSGTAESGSTVRLYSDLSGNTVIGSATATDGSWSITVSALSAATHAITAKATDASNNESVSSSALTITIDTNAPNAPSAPDLATSSDSGSSNTDNITNDTTPTFSGTGTNGDTITLSSNLDGSIGTTTVSGGVWSITASTMQVGSHTVSAQASDAAGNVTSSLSTLAVSIDTAAPSGHSVVFGDTLYSNDEKTAASFSFTGAEVGSTYSYTISSSNGGTAATGTGTVTSAGQTISNIDLSALNDGTLTLSVVLTDTAGNAASAVTASSTLDTAAPSGHSVALNDTVYNSSETNSVNFSFSSAEVGASYTYTLNSSNGGTSVTGNGNVTSASQTVSLSDISGLNDGTLTLSVSVLDAAGNTANAVIDTATLDKTKPTVTTFSASDTNLKAGETSTISIVLSEASTTFTSSDITVSGGSLSNFSSTSNTQYSVVFTPTADSETNATLDIAADTFTDAAGNNNTAATQLAITVDTQAPSGHSVSFGDSLYGDAEKTAASFSFTGAEVGATYSYTISSSGGGTAVTGTGTINTATDTISNLDLSGLNDGDLTLSVTLTDTAGNAATAVTHSSVLDTTAPSGHSVTLNRDTYNGGQTGTVNFAFTGAEVGASYNYTLSGSGGTPLTGSGTLSSVTQTISIADISGLDDGGLTLSVTVTDTAGNAATAVTDTASLDATKPTVTTFSAVDNSLKAGETSTINITLSEASTTFTSSDITVSGGALSNFAATSSTQYSVVFTPTANSETNATLDIAADTFTDAAGNNNTAATQLAITVDTQAPSGHSVSFGDSLYGDAEKTAASFSFTGAEVGATYSYTISSSGGGTAVTGTGTISTATDTISNLDLSGLNDGDLTLSVTLTDTAGNVATATTASSMLDTASPSVTTFTATATSLKSTETATINISLSESSSNFASQDITAVGGSLSNFTATSATQYSVTFTPSANYDANATLDINAGVFTDAAGNNNTAAAQIIIDVDTQVPAGHTVSIDQSEINRANEAALSFSLSGLESSGSFTYTITDGTSSVNGSGSITSATASVTGVNVSSLNEGTLTLSVIVSDTAGNNAQAVTDTVTKRYNVAPQLTGTPAASVNEDAEYSFTPTLTDPDTSDTHTYSIVNKPIWAAFDTQTGKLSGTPTDTHVDAYTGIVITVSDGTDSASLTSFDITVNNTNDAPVGQNVSFSLNEGGLLTKAQNEGLLTLASDDDTDSGDTLTVSAVAQPQFGQLTLNTDGSFSYQHDDSENHADSFTYQVVDSSNETSATYTVTLTITPVADAPTVVNDTAQTDEDTAVNINLLDNDSDPEGDMVASSAAIVTQPTKGSVSIANGVATYTPNEHVNGQDSFTYTVKDAQGNTSSAATVTLTINAVNDAPVAANTTIAIDEDTASQATSLKDIASDVEDTNPTGELALVTNPAKGAVTFDQNAGTFIYTPNANEVGQDTFTYTINDSAGLASNTATVTVNIGAVNDRPVVGNDTVTTDEDVSTTLNILTNDSDVEDSGFNGANISLEDQGSGAGEYAKATVTVSADGTLDIAPKQDETGSFTFTYTLTDSEQLASLPATVTVNLTPVNDAPVANDNSAQLQEDGSFEVNVLGNDTDVDVGDTLDASSVTVVSAAQNGKTTVNADGSITYSANEHYFGDDSFTYTVKDAAGAVSNEATVSMTITSVNDAPVANAQAVSLDEDNSLIITLSGTDQENDTLSYSIVDSVSNGSLTQQTDTTWLYQPNGNYNGVDSFTFKANDGALDSDAATVNITVNAVNDKPVATAQSVNGNEDTDITITLSATDTEGSELSYSIVTNPVNGIASLIGNTVTYRGNANFNGDDSFTFKANDGELDSDAVTVNITVDSVNDMPEISGTPSSLVNEDASYSFTPTASDNDGDTLTFSVTNLPSWASFNTATGQISGTPVNSQVGVYKDIQITVTDGTESVSLTEFSITVVNTNDAPVISGTPASSVDEDTAYSFTPTASDVDVGDSLTFSITNKPSWAQFDTATGALTGTPSNDDVATYSDIVISVSDGTATTSLSAFNLTVNNTNDAPIISGTPALMKIQRTALPQRPVMWMWVIVSPLVSPTSQAGHSLIRQRVR